jgi:carbon monoxide dehydrogenase subunit G
MIQTERTLEIEAPIADVWDYARDISGWAKLMPGLQACAIIDQNDSQWTLKVGAGGLVRTVQVFVHVERWEGPEEVDFTFSLKGDPVQGGGSYRARRLHAGATEVALAVRVQGTGPMAPMWEAIGKPLLPKFAGGFAEQFKQEVEREAAVGAVLAAPEKAAAAAGSMLARVVAWVRRLFGSRQVVVSK